MSQQSSPEILISVIIVNYKVPECLRESIRSLYQAELFNKTEIIVVDNASGDQSQKLITEEFKEVIWIQLKFNIGFGKACNIGAQNARGHYLLFLNPDTVINKDTLSVAVEFMKTHPHAGIMGPKILNPDGSLQASCRRGFPTPMVALYHFSGLSRLFPRSKRFGRYNMTYLDPEQSSEVDAISGSFMFVRKELFSKVKGFDERFFMYGEDLDLCWRIHVSGYSVWYHPQTLIIHRKGRSSAKNLIRSRMAFYEAMLIFSKKYPQGAYFPNWLIFLGIASQACLNIGANLIGNFTAALIDLLVINTTLWAGLTLRFVHSYNPYGTANTLSLLGIHAFISGSYLFMFSYNGIYSTKRYSVKNAIFSGLLASILFFAAVYFVKTVAFSRIAFALVSTVLPLFLVAWRELIPKLIIQCRQIIFTPDRIVVLGSNSIAVNLIRSIEEQKSGKIIGLIWDDGDLWPGQFHGYPVLGHSNDLKNIMKKNKIDMLLIATHLPWYSQIIEVISALKVKNLTIRWVPHDLFKKENEIFPGQIILNDFSV